MPVWEDDFLTKLKRNRSYLTKFQAERAQRNRLPRRRSNPFRDNGEEEELGLGRQTQPRLTLAQMLGQPSRTTALATRPTPALSVRRETPTLAELMRGRGSGAVSERVTAPFQMPGPIKAPKFVRQLKPLGAEKEQLLGAPPPSLPSLDWFDRVNELKKSPTELVPFLSSGVEIYNVGKLLKIANDFDAGREVSREDLSLLQEYINHANREKTWGYQVADIMLQLPAFAGEFLATGGIYSVGRVGTIKAASVVLKKLATKKGAALLEKKLGTIALETAGVLGGGTLRSAAVGVSRVPASTLEKQLTATLTGDEESVWQSAKEAFGENWIEVVSENTGGAFNLLTNPLKGRLLKNSLFKAFRRANPSKSIGDIQRVAEKLGYHGVWGEMFEERVADVGHGVLAPLGLSGQKFKLPTVSDLTAELVAFSVPGAAQIAATRIAGARIPKGYTIPAGKIDITLGGKRAGLTPAIWNATPVAQRVSQAQAAGLSGQVGSKPFEALTPGERTALQAGGRAPLVPKAVTKAPAIPAKRIPKESWQFTRQEIQKKAEGLLMPGAGDRSSVDRQLAYHKAQVVKALSEGKPVPAEVLKDYPDLAKQAQVAPVTPEVIAPIPKAEVGMPEAVTAEIPPVVAEAPPTVAEAAPPPPIKPPLAGEGIAPPKPPLPPGGIETAPTPPEGSAGKRILDRIQTEPAPEGWVEKIKQGYHHAQVKMIDDLYAIKKFTEQATQGGLELSTEENPYLLARLLRGVTGKANVFIENGTYGKTFWKMEKGRAVPNFTGESLENILQEVRKPEQWQDFSAYLVARRSVRLAGRSIKTGITKEDASAAIKELEAKNKNFPDLAQRLYKYQDSLLVYANEMGLLSPDLLAKLRRYGEYVPFYRVFNELQAKGFMGKKMANIASPIKRIKGSEREIINPLESIIKNTYVLISAADRNQVGIMIANLVDKNPELADVFERVKTPIARVARVSAKELGVEIEGLSKADAEAVVDIFRPSFFTKGDEVTVLINGKKAYFRVDPDLRDALLNLDRETLGLIGKLFGAPARVLRAGATLSPDFAVRNPMRDALSAFVFSEYGFLPGVDTIRGLAEAIGKGADYQLFRMSGAEYSMMVSLDREYLSKTFREVVEGKGFTDYVKSPMELLRLASEFGERASRLGEFKAGIRRGATPMHAGYSARSVTLDFAQAGTTARAMNTMIAFFNAQIRGTARPFSAFKEHPKRTALKIFIGITLPSILLYYANRDDPRWKEIPQWQKDLSWIVFLKSLPENWETMTAKEKADYLSLTNMVGAGIYRIPKPFELGILFGSVPERFLEWLDNKDPELMKNVLGSVVEAGTPGIIPTAGLPILEWLTNYSFFRGQAIVPASRKNMPPELQYTKWSSEVSKELGELLKLSPAKIDNTINGWTGGLGRYAVNGLDIILKKTGISPDIPEPSPELADIPVLKAFVVRSPYGSSGQAVENFYKQLEKYEQGEKFLKEMLKLGEVAKFEKYKAKHPELLFFYDSQRKDHYSASARYLRKVSRNLSELTKKQDLIYKDRDISPVEKRRLIDEIDFLKTDLSRQALDFLAGKRVLSPAPEPAAPTTPAPAAPIKPKGTRPKGFNPFRP